MGCAQRMPNAIVRPEPAQDPEERRISNGSTLIHLACPLLLLEALAAVGRSSLTRRCQGRLEKHYAGLSDREFVNVERLGEKDGFLYPKKGNIYWKVSQTSHIDDKFKGTEYSYEVIEVNRLKDVRRDTWFPKLPPRTDVRDKVARE